MILFILYAMVAIAVANIRYNKNKTKDSFYNEMLMIGSIAIGIFWIVTVPVILQWKLISKLVKTVENKNKH